MKIEQLQEIRECYEMMEKGVSNPQLVNRCYKHISGQDMCFGGMRAKELRIVRYYMIGYQDALKQAEKHNVTLTDTGSDITPNFDGVKIDSAKSENTNPEDQSHQEDYVNDAHPIIRHIDAEIGDTQVDDEVTKLVAELQELEDNQENKRRRQTLKMMITKRNNILNAR